VTGQRHIAARAFSVAEGLKNRLDSLTNYGALLVLGFAEMPAGGVNLELKEWHISLRGAEAGKASGAD